MSLVRVLLCVLGFHKYDPEPDRYYSNRCVRCGHSPLTGKLPELRAWKALQICFGLGISSIIGARIIGAIFLLKTLDLAVKIRIGYYNKFGVE